VTVSPLDLKRLRVFPLAERRSLTRAETILIDPATPPPALEPRLEAEIRGCAERVRAARARGAAVMLIYGAHLLRNGAARLLDRLLEQGWLTHMATNGAGSIHDWEYACMGASTESVEQNVATGTFGTWDETATNIHLALMTGALDGLGYGRALGRFIAENGTMLPERDALEAAIAAEPAHPLTAARADLLCAVVEHGWLPGRHHVEHRWPHSSIVASAYRRGVPITVHPGIGYDIITNHPVFNGAVLGRAGGLDFALFAGSVENLNGGVVLSIGSAVMGPQVFEKALSCVNNLRIQAGRGIVHDHAFYVVDLQDGGGWDWNRGEPPKTNPAYYLRFCKSFSRMGGPLHYLQCDNAAFVHRLHHELAGS
jgi:hypothetical protein